MAKLTREAIKARETVILAELNTKENGVRKGTLLILAIAEHTEESPAFADAHESMSRRIFKEITAEKEFRPMYKPMVD